MTVEAGSPSVEVFAAQARAWLETHAEAPHTQRRGWREGDFDVAVFHNLSETEEADLLKRTVAWQQEKGEPGYHAIDWPAEYGGLGLSRGHARAFAREESRFHVPAGHELLAVTTGLVAPTVARYGTEEQRHRFVASLLRAEVLCCQLFSEPGAGSDLASLDCRAERDGDGWVVNGQKVWSSGARFAAWGELICRTDPDVPQHRGLTAFLVPMDTPGIEVRPIRQMSGGSSFNEVFFSDVRIPDDVRLGEVGDGWKVALATLSFERAAAGSGSGRVGGSWRDVFALARHLGATGEPVVRQALARTYVHQRLLALNAARAAAAARSGSPGPEASIGKLWWTQGMVGISDVVTLLLGPRLAVDTGEWGTFGWAEHVLGAPGYRIAGGSDEIQRNLIAERVLGLPPEPRPDRDRPWRELRHSGPAAH